MKIKIVLAALLFVGITYIFFSKNKIEKSVIGKYDLIMYDLEDSVQHPIKCSLFLNPDMTFEYNCGMEIRKGKWSAGEWQEGIDLNLKFPDSYEEWVEIRADSGYNGEEKYDHLDVLICFNGAKLNYSDVKFVNLFFRRNLSWKGV